MSRKVLKFLGSHIPIVGWLPKYTKNDIIADFISGLSVGLTMMPQSIAYAGLAGLPPQYGLYTAFIGSFTYIFFGTIKEVSIGPTSLMSIMTLSYTEGLPVEYVILLSFLAGCVELLMGVLKLGFLVDFISPAITSGFTSASAIIIILAQMKHFLGIKLNSHGFTDMLLQLVKNLGHIRWSDASLALICTGFLVGLKHLGRIKAQNRVAKKILWLLSISKNALCVLFALLVSMIWEKQGGSPFYLTGPVPQGLPTIRPPSFTATSSDNSTVSTTQMLQDLGSGIVVVPLVAVLANVAIAKSYASDVAVDATQEMITLGLCNIFGSFVQAMPSCGAFTRSAVASSSDVRTPLQGLYSASVIILALSLLTPYFYFIPKAALAAVLVTAASSLIDYEIYPKLWRTSKFDFCMALLSFVVGVFYGVEVSVLIGAGLNMLLLLKPWTRPKIFSEIRSLDTGRQYVYIKPELGFYYPACDYLTEQVKALHRKNNNLPIGLDCANVLRIDYAGCKALSTLINDYNKEKVHLVLLNVDPDVRLLLAQSLEDSHLGICNSTDCLSDSSFDMPKIPKEMIPLLVQKGDNV